MGSNPINLALRFLLELWAMFAMGYWGWMYGEGWLSFFLAIGIPVIAAACWGTFAVPDDPSRSGRSPIAIPGILRILLELAIFTIAVWALNDVGLLGLSWALGILVTVHYLGSYDRIRWLIGQ